MKKLFLTLVLVMLGLNIYANEVNNSKYIQELKWEKMYSDSIKFHIDYETKIIYLNFDKYNNKFYKFNELYRFRTNNAAKLETLAFNNDELIGVSMLFYSDGKIYVIIKNFKTGGLVKYNLNS
jgi:hypothetical protein